jgi:phospholipid/cholesterol/gamma-HCH transport system ATP-binding protein
MIKVIDLWKRFDNLEVLRGVNIEVYEGETFVIIGQSGVGKSVFLKLIIGLLKPDQGKIFVQGHEVTAMTERELNKLRIQFGMVFQYAALFDSLNVFENVAFGLMEHTDLDDEHITARVKECLRLVGLEGVEEKMPAELSGGMKKRVAIARAIALNPKIILYDEPTAGLDPVVASSINKLIKELKEKTGATSIVVTHDMKSAYEVGDRITMLYQGQFIEVGTPDEIMNTHNPVVRQFINGEPEGPIKVP